MKPTSEQAFETAIETHLVGNGYMPIASEGFDRTRAIFPDSVLAFICDTQPEEWAKLKALHGDSQTQNLGSFRAQWRAGALLHHSPGH